MRRTLRSFTPMRLLAVIAVSNLLIISVVVVFAAASRHIPEDQHLPPKVRIVGLSVLFLFLAVTLLAEQVLLKGIRSEAWDESLLAAPRRLLDRTWPLLIVAMVASILCFIVLPLRNAPLATFLLLAPLSFSRISLGLRQKEGAFESVPHIAPYPTRPLHSDKWGE